MERFWFNSRNIRQSIATGSESFPGEMLNPQSEIVLSKKMLDLMVEYYLASYENFDFQAPFDDGLEDSIVISRVIINKFGRCRIGSEVFGSIMSSRHVKNSFILVNFILMVATVLFQYKIFFADLYLKFLIVKMPSNI